MPGGSEPSNEHVTCVPGDVIVTRVASGYLIARALPLGPGPWWEYVSVVHDYAEAARSAHTLARELSVRAWLNPSSEHYDPLKLPPLPALSAQHDR